MSNLFIMTNQVSCNYSIIQAEIARKKLSFSHFIPEPKYELINGNHLNCDFVFDPQNATLEIKGNSLEEIEECANHIIRTLNRKQDWGFHYSNLRTGCRGIIEENDKFSGFSDMRVAVSIDQEVVKSDFIQSISNEYRLPEFLELLFKEAISNYSMGKHRTAFFLMYTALERAIKLLYIHHCQLSYNHRIQIDHMLLKLMSDASVQLQVNVARFDENSNYRDIRRTIAHGEPRFSNPKIDLKVEFKSLMEDVDDIFRQTASLLQKYKQYL